jgi:hypothetical protein
MSEEFYAYIANLSNISVESKILNKDSDAITEFILRDWGKHVEYAAASGLTKAYICIYEIGAKYNHVIPMDEHIRPTGKFIDKFTEYNIIPVCERIRKIVKPFVLSVELLSREDVAKMTDKEEKEIMVSEVDDKKEKNIVALTIMWEKKEKLEK